MQYNALLRLVEGRQVPLTTRVEAMKKAGLRGAAVLEYHMHLGLLTSIVPVSRRRYGVRGTCAEGEVIVRACTRVTPLRRHRRRKTRRVVRCDRCRFCVRARAGVPAI